MNRLLGIVTTMLLGLILLVPVAAAADPWDSADEHFIFTTNGDITLPADRRADMLVIVNGTATIEGEARSVVVINGTANFVGSRTESVIAIRSDVRLDATSAVDGNIRTIDSTIDQASGATVSGTVRDFTADLAAGWLIVGGALFLLYLGFVAATVISGVFLAGVAGRQVREAGALIGREPVATVIAAFAGMAGIITLAVLAIVTVIGIPLGLAMLILVLPLLAFAGYLVAGIWVGDLILSRTSPAVQRDRPYLAAIVGVLAVGAISFIPVIGGLVSFVGFGAVVLRTWRNLRGAPSAVAPAARPAMAPAG